MLGAVVIVEDATSLGEALLKGIPDPSSPVGDKSHADPLPIDALSGHVEALSELGCILYPMPTRHMHNAAKWAN